MKLEMGIAYDNRSGAGIQGRSGHSKDGTGHRRRPDRPARPRSGYVDRDRELGRVEDRNCPDAVDAWRAPHVMRLTFGTCARTWHLRKRPFSISPVPVKRIPILPDVP